MIKVTSAVVSFLLSLLVWALVALKIFCITGVEWRTIIILAVLSYLLKLVYIST
ncbi:MAG: hypothetical protein ACM3Q2_00295 [Syntrophothermus sp.]